jgi:CubicO group peptidase (beta-lactamase class C family)
MLQRLDSIAMWELRETRTPGATLAIVVGDRVVYAQGYGIANVETGQSMTPDMALRLGSTTKMMTSLAAVALAEKGVVGLDRPIGEMAPGITAPRLRALTLRQLLTHNAGLLDYTSMAGPHDDAALNTFVPTLTDTAFFTRSGDVFSYSNLGYSIAGYVMSEASKKPYADVMAEQVFAPLGMRRSTMRPIEVMTFPMAQGHDASRESGAAVIRPAPDDARYWPAGSAFTTARDFSRLVIALLNDGRVDGKQALPTNVVKTLMTPQVAMGGEGSGGGEYAFGLMVRAVGEDRVVEHSGARAGFGSVMRLLPDRHVGAIVLANRSGSNLNRTLDAAIAAVVGGTRETTTARSDATALTASDVAALEGRWTNGRASVVEFRPADGGLTASVGTGTPMPVRRAADGRYLAGELPLSVISGKDGTTRYLMVGARAYRREDPSRSGRPPND